jgi:hypothetical protein
MNAIAKIRESSAPTLLEDSSERQPSVASSPSDRISVDTEFTTGETIAAAEATSTTGGSHLSADTEAPKVQRPLWPLVVAIAVVLILIGALAVVLIGRNGQRQDIAPPPPVAQHQAHLAPQAQPDDPSNTSDGSTASATVEISIAVQPETATISIDGTKVDDNPFVGQFMIDRNQHTIRAEARGHETKTWTISFTEDRELSAKLSQKSSTKTKRPVKQKRRSDDDPWAGESKSRGPAKEDPWAD